MLQLCTFILMILVTGGTGLVGAHLLAQLVGQHNKVRATKRTSSDLSIFYRILEGYYTDASLMKERIEWVVADVTDVPALTRAFQGVNKVYHCAAYISFDPKHFHKLKKSNIEGTANVVNLSLQTKVAKLVHVSSIATLGQEAGNKPMNENSEWNPEVDNSVYAITKYGAEMEVWRGQQEGLSTAIVNPGVIIGPGNWRTGSCVIFKQAKKGIPRYTEGSSGFVGVWDVVDAMQRLMEGSISGERYVLVSDNLNYKSFLGMVCQALDMDSPSKAIGRGTLIWLAHLDRLRRTFFGGKPKLLKATVEALCSPTQFDGSKALEIPGFQYAPIKDAIDRTAQAYLLDV